MYKNLKLVKTGLVAGSMLLAVSMMLSACGSKTTQETASPAAAKPAESATATVTPAALPEVKLTWYFPGNFPQPEQDKVFAEVNKVLKAKLNATVDFKPLAFGDYDQKMQVVIASGEAYDIAFTASWINNYSQDVAKGALLPLDDLLTKYAPKSYASVPKSMWDATKVKGKIYGFVNQQISARTPALMFPKDLTDKYKLDLSSVSGKINADTLNLLEPYVTNVHKDDPKKAFITSFDQFGDLFNLDYISGFNVPGGVDYADGSLKVVNQFETPQAKKFAATMRDWNAKGLLNSKERVSQKKDEWTDAKAGKWAMNIGGAYKPGGNIGETAQAGYPMVDAPAGTQHLTTGGITATMQGINRNSKNPERAMMVLELLNTDKDLYNLLNFGMKDNHFKIDGDGFMVPGDNQKAYNPQVAWMFASNFLANVEKGMPKTVWDDTKKINETATPSKLLGFNFDAEPVKSEIAKTSAVYDEYSRSIELGIASEDKYNEFLAKLKTAGSDKIIAEMQKQVDAWKSSK
ncbi:ABC transporter substrate-binding protein [Paenibacillus roseipurpureus]|uniref:ABC transporter substrate-binding protein n=1 Tax=Paenibacillus roseopurpureus TaxID=2918901 RepID=A0AA96LKJ5_9BACL|nr:ABC transporter substrate-binding protein [Paenibacillus sp. MBLB1832]WNR42766.1 ABC transporter substrate-binding protein [Paenibacillus sp. MBLB1832]